jgi:sodium transport system permease protein
MTMLPFSLERIGIIFSKEVMDNIRDRRTLTNSLFLPLLGPLILALLLISQVQTMTKGADQALSLPIVGSQYAPQLVEFLRQKGVVMPTSPLNPKLEVQSGTHEVILVIAPDYQKAFQATRPATVQIMADSSRPSAQLAISRTQALLDSYSQQVGAQRLSARGMSSTLTEVLALKEVDVATPQSRGAFILNLLPYFIIFAAFSGGLYITIDMVTGERERNSLEPLVINPVTRQELVLGKLSAALLFTAIGVAETLIGFALMLTIAPVEKLGVQLTPTPLTFLWVFLITLPIMLVAGSLQMVVATFTRNFREALTYLSLIPLVPALPGLFISFLPIKAELWMMLIPTGGQQLLINQLLRGETVNLFYVGISTLATLATGAFFVGLATRLFGREQMILGR